MIETIEISIVRYIESVKNFKELMKNQTGQSNYYNSFADLEIKIFSKSKSEKEKTEFKNIKRLLSSKEQQCKEETLKASALLREYYGLSEDEVRSGGKYVDIWKGFTYTNEVGEIKESEELMQSIYNLIHKWNIEEKMELVIEATKIKEPGKEVLPKDDKKGMEDKKSKEVVLQEWDYTEKEDGQLSLI